MAHLFSTLFHYLHGFSSLYLTLYLLILTIPVFLIIYTQKKYSSSSKLCLPPSPPSLPLLGHLHRLGILPHRSLHHLSSNYGPIMYLRLGSVPTVVLSSAAAVEESVRFHDTTLSSRPNMAVPDILMYGSSDVAFSPYGEYWRQARRIVVLHLLSAKRVQSFGFIREQEVSLMINNIRSNFSNNGGCSTVVNLSSMLFKLTNGIICRAALGFKFSDDSSEKAHGLLQEFITHLGKPLIGELVPCFGWLDRLAEKRVKKTSDGLDSFLETTIEEHVKARRHAPRDSKYSGQKEGSDLVDTLLDIQENDNEVGFSLSRNNIKAIILDMFAAGTDTVYTTLEWTMAELIKNPKKMERVQEEVRNVISEAGEMTEELVKKMAYLNAAIKESLRLHPSLPLLVPRESTKAIDLMGFHIPGGTRFIINAWAIGRDPDVWERADEFMPERFLGGNVDYRGLHFGFIPFGVGRRSCPGIDFAEGTIALALVSLLYYFDWNLPNDMKPLDMSEINGVSVHKKLNLILEAQPRSI